MGGLYCCRHWPPEPLQLSLGDQNAQGKSLCRPPFGMLDCVANVAGFVRQMVSQPFHSNSWAFGGAGQFDAERCPSEARSAVQSQNEGMV